MVSNIKVSANILKVDLLERELEESKKSLKEDLYTNSRLSYQLQDVEDAYFGCTGEKKDLSIDEKNNTDEELRQLRQLIDDMTLGELKAKETQKK